MKLATFLLYVSVCSFNQIAATEIQFKSTKEDFLKQLTEIWKSAEVSIQTEEHEFNSIKKEYLIISVTSESSISEEEFSSLVSSTSTLIFKDITNTGDFKVARVDYKNTTANDEKSKIIYEVIDKAPVLKGCNKNADKATLKRCFNETVMLHIQKNFDTSKFENLGLEKKKHNANASFTINKKGKITNIVVKHENNVVKEEVTQLMKSLKVKKPGFNNGKPVEVSYTIPIVFIID